MTEAELAKDYADASNYISDFYSIKEAIVEDYADAAKTAVFNFFLKTSIKEEKVDFDMFSVLVDLTFLLMPHIKFVKTGVEKFIKIGKEKIQYEFLDDSLKKMVESLAGTLYSKAEEQAKTAISSLGKSGSASNNNDSAVVHFAGKAMENTTALKSVLRQMAIFEREVIRSAISLIFDQQPAKRGQLKNLVINTIGQKPVYTPSDIIYFGKQYELKLYQQFYANKAYVEININHYRGSETLKVVGMPEAVMWRIMELANLPDIFYITGFWHLKRVTKQTSGVAYGA